MEDLVVKVPTSQALLLNYPEHMPAPSTFMLMDMEETSPTFTLPKWKEIGVTRTFYLGTETFRA